MACLVAILGSSGSLPSVTSFHHAWVFMIACSLLAGAVLQGIGSPAAEVADATVAETSDAPEPAPWVPLPGSPPLAPSAAPPAPALSAAVSASYVEGAGPRISGGR